ncbi:MAG: hypothetical protein M3R15_00835, partial [Acidobacteriota bacterium]|nr:hypothetical protein [Acidobacteriota bacterium]
MALIASGFEDRLDVAPEINFLGNRLSGRRALRRYRQMADREIAQSANEPDATDQKLQFHT